MDAPIYTRGRARRSLIDTVTFRVLSQITTALALIIQVAFGHGSVLSVRMVLGILFVAAGAGRSYLELRRGRGA